jgi:hypothetical protein
MSCGHVLTNKLLVADNSFVKVVSDNPIRTGKLFTSERRFSRSNPKGLPNLRPGTDQIGRAHV